MWEDAKKAMLCVFLVPGRASSYPGLGRGPSRRRSGCGGWGHVVLETWWPLWIRLMPEMSIRVCKRATVQGCIVCGPSSLSETAPAQPPGLMSRPSRLQNRWAWVGFRSQQRTAETMPWVGSRCYMVTLKTRCLCIYMFISHHSGLLRDNVSAFS